jgi:hypothetical protein
MKIFKLFVFFSFIITTKNSFSQVGNIKINQDKKLIELLKIKKEVNEEDFTSGQYTIQIYSGNYEEGSKLIENLKSDEKFSDVFFSFETPYYKIRIGKYVSKIEAIKQLKKIKKTFSSAFILKPK